MILLDVSNDAEDRQKTIVFEYDCVSVAGQPQHLVVVVGQDTSTVTGDRPNIRHALADASTAIISRGKSECPYGLWLTTCKLTGKAEHLYLPASVTRLRFDRDQRHCNQRLSEMGRIGCLRSCCGARYRDPAESGVHDTPVIIPLPFTFTFRAHPTTGDECAAFFIWNNV